MDTTAGNGPFSLSVVDSYAEMSSQAADAVQEALDRTPDAAITLPTGGTPVGMYQELVRRQAAGALDLHRAQIFLLDEYYGASQHDEASLTRWLFEVFLIPARIPERNIHLIPSAAADPIAAAAEYEEELASLGGLELAVVGLGPNGHVAFNEPGSAPDSRTRLLDLTEESRNQSSAYWEGEAKIPEQAMTMGLGTILEARWIVLIASGIGKAGIVRRSLEDAPSLDVPGSWLPSAGERLHVILDRESASELTTTT
ncbi:MAG: glucosamine-6-phosphate deaminase [Chloroflexia bacterium]|jgi:glucosamine-6-phosphate deaminase|nr:glucosamine-6-phosphate deaminase [Chloroflexia bacterium]